jgi:hypothetical protein
MKTAIILVPLAACVIAGCWRSSGPYQAAAPDADTDADSDTDVDTDTDSDSDSDTDGDTDTGSETDTGTDTDTGSETDTGTGSDTDTGTVGGEPALAWAIHTGSNDSIYVHDVAPLSTGGAAVVGDVRGLLDGGDMVGTMGIPGVIYGFLLVSDGAGALVMDSPLGTTGGNSRAMAVAALPDDSVIVAGGFSGDWSGLIYPDPGPLISAGEMDAYVARFDPDGDPAGEMTWIRQIGGAGWDLATSVSRFDTDALLVVGYFGYGGGSAASVTLSLGEPDETTLTGWGGDCAFYAIYDLDGNLAEAAPIACGLTADPPLRAASGGDGTLHLMGTIDDLATVGILPDAPRHEFGPPGDRAWFQVGFGADRAEDASSGGMGDDAWATSLAIASSGEVAVGGGFGDFTDLIGDAIMGATDIESGDGRDGIVTYWAESGAYLWHRQIACGALDAIYAVTAPGEGGVCFAGAVGGEVGDPVCAPDLGGGEPWEAPPETVGGEDVVAGCADASGELHRAWLVGSTAADRATAIAASDLGALFVAGTYEGEITFGAGGENETTLALDPIAAGPVIIGLFLAKYEI